MMISGIGYWQAINGLDCFSLCLWFFGHTGFLYNKFSVQMIVSLVNGFYFPTVFDKVNIGEHFVLFYLSVLQSCDCVLIVLLTRLV